PLFPAPRFRLLIDLQFEEAGILAPELDVAERVAAGGAVEEFEFDAEALDRIFGEIAEFASGVRAAAPAVGATAGRGHDPLVEAARAALARGQFDRAVALAQQAATGDGRGEALVVMGEAFLRRGLAGEALERFRAALDAAGGGGEVDDLVRRDALRGCARSLLLLDRVEGAIAVASELCEVATEEAGAHRLLGQALARAGRAKDAGEAFERPRALRGEAPAVLAELGSALLDAGELANAEVVLRRAVELDDDAAAARVALARVLEQVGRLDESAAELRSALAIVPSYGEAALMLAQLERRRGRLREAIHVLADLLTVDPSHLGALAELGSLLVDSGRIDEAAHAFRRVLRF